MRRAIVLVLGISALAGLGCSSSGEAQCAGGLTRCGDECINTLFDPTNCGGCGVTCDPGLRCDNGICADPCVAPLQACGDACVNTTSNPEHCGTCNNRCPAGQLCSNGRCQGTDCPVGLEDCGGTCVDLQNDRANCGRCGQACSDGPCVGGSCQTGCPTDLTECDGTCVDTDKDVAHCGRCNNPCDPGQTCSGGSCQSAGCPPGQTDCDGECFNLQTDSDHCGDCARSCDAGQVCSEGDCGTSCASGLTPCDGDCVDTTDDRENCGSCGRTCPSGQACVDSDCALACPDGQTECDGECFNTETDPQHCGDCTTTCRDDQICRGGCQCPDSRTECDGACVDTRVDPDHCGSDCAPCADGQVCVNSECVADCDPPLTACGGYCVDTTRDRNHCGDCNDPCGATETCVGSACIPGASVPGDTCASPIDVSGGGRFTGNTDGAGADYEGWCGGTTGPDVVFRYTLAEESDVYMNTFGSDYDTLIYVRRDPCGSGTDFACNDDAGDWLLQSELNLLNQFPGTYYVFLDAFGASGGDYSFDIYFSEPSWREGDACGDPEFFDLETVTTLDDDTCDWLLVDFRDDTRTCAGLTGGYDQVWYFVVESTTTVTFETCGTTDGWDTILDLRRVCNDGSDDSRVACNDDSCGVESSITATLEPGAYYLWIDGWSEEECGDYEIAVTAS